MVDSSAFNDIIRAFLMKVVKGVHLTKPIEEKLKNELYYIFDEMTAKEVFEEFETA